ncbi:hypothetical protein CPB84DRAFT_711145 [Gymnopilus junonius]|uniref:BHLH domain-containing protein n=1 Tax=Gymnopilus junonius TaxID=109634 RepID=A0A9P5NPC7_GYMJU|nr:hypothetical protein CPB84DRAFT_711145 [Gymnopilus junonius]
MDPTSPMSTSTPNTPHALPVPTGSGSTSNNNNNNNGGGGPTIHIRKTSHKAAEQKRRDSLKTTFDDLRTLLPPIALPNDADADPSAITSPLFHPTTPLLPGALPPRGPPKAGGEGPNKGVSKLQLLICGNEYIRILKGRVERRDEEVEKLRREVARLRVRTGKQRNEGMMEDEDVREDVQGEEEAEAAAAAAAEEEKCDLEKDLDAVERNGMQRPNQGAAKSGAAADDAMDEGDDEGDE